MFLWDMNTRIGWRTPRVPAWQTGSADNYKGYPGKYVMFTCVVVMLGRLLRRRANINTTHAEHHVFVDKSFPAENVEWAIQDTHRESFFT